MSEEKAKLISKLKKSDEFIGFTVEWTKNEKGETRASVSSVGEVSPQGFFFIVQEFGKFAEQHDPAGMKWAEGVMEEREANTSPISYTKGEA